MVNMDQTTLLSMAIMLVIGFSTGNVCAMPSSSHIKSRPPGWVFGVVWTIMYALMGYLGVLAYRNPLPWVFMLFVFHSACVIAWPFAFSCKREPKYALLLLTAAIMSGFAVVLSVAFEPDQTKLMYIPYMTWLCFATILNVLFIENKKP